MARSYENTVDQCVKFIQKELTPKNIKDKREVKFIGESVINSYLNFIQLSNVTPLRFSSFDDYHGFIFNGRLSRNLQFSISNHEMDEVVKLRLKIKKEEEKKRREEFDKTWGLIEEDYDGS